MTLGGVRPAGPEDHEAVREVVRAAFGATEGPQVAHLVDVLVESGDCRVSLVAEEGVSPGEPGRLVGHVQLNRCWLDAEERLVEVLVLSPLSVRPDRQRRGVGRTLVAAALSAAEAAGSPLVCLEGSPAYYGALGFVPAAAHALVRPSVRIPEAACQVVLLPAWRPWMRGALVYCDAFWRTDTVGLRGQELAEARARWDG